MASTNPQTSDSADLASAVYGFLHYEAVEFEGISSSEKTHEPLRQAQWGRLFEDEPDA